jgi:hypothetical protein
VTGLIPGPSPKEKGEVGLIPGPSPKEKGENFALNFKIVFIMASKGE